MARSECGACREVFSSEGSFNKHRTGSFNEKTRRCMSKQEMLDKGMAQNDRDIWVTALFEGDTSFWSKKEEVAQ